MKFLKIKIYIHFRLTGFITMKAGKIAAVAVGGGILILQIAQHKGYIHINWDKVYNSADKMIDKIEEQATGKGPDAMDKVKLLLLFL